MSLPQPVFFCYGIIYIPPAVEMFNPFHPVEKPAAQRLTPEEVAAADISGDKQNLN